MVTTLRASNDQFDERVNHPSYSAEERDAAQALVDANLFTVVWEFHQRLYLPPMALAVWQGLTPNQREDLGGDMSAAYAALGVLGVWMQTRGHANRFQAIVCLAEEHGHYSVATLRRLRTLVGLDSTLQRPSGDLRWDDVSKTLYFRGAIARQLQARRRASNLERIIQAFDAASWPEAIDAEGTGLQGTQLYKALHDLNKGMRVLSFHVGSRDDVQVIYWRAEGQP